MASHTFPHPGTAMRIHPWAPSKKIHRAVAFWLLLLSLATAPGLAGAGDSRQNSSGHRLITQQRVQQLKQAAAELRERIKAHQNRGSNGSGNASLESLQAKVASLESSMTALLNADNTMLTTLQAAQTQIAALQARIGTLENRPPSGGGVPGLEQYVSIDPNPLNGVNGPNLIIRGVNVHVQSGSGATVDTTTGLGNLIIGYNETHPSIGLLRNGSHNLVGGEMNSFSSSGGLVFGVRNTISGQYAAVLSGERNVASGVTSSILGGGQNTVSGQYSTIFGGQLNVAPASYSIRPELQSGGG